jgi:hypothetical protein
MPTPREHIAVVALNGLIYALGGTNTSGNIAYPIVEVYNPETDSWATVAPMPTGRWHLGAGVTNGQIYAIGGHTPTIDALATVEAYDPSTNTWTAQCDMPTARGGPIVGVVNNVLYVVGGYNGGGDLATNEAFGLTTLTATGTTLSAKTGHRFAAVAASFTDIGPNPGAATDYSAVVDWGDGSSLSTGGITDNGGGNYDVVASHTYAAAGEYQATITITDNRDPSRTATAYTTIDVYDHRRGHAPTPHNHMAALATLPGAEPNLLLNFPLANTSRSVEAALTVEHPMTHLPLPTSALEAWWTQDNRPLALRFAWTVVVDPAAHFADPLGAEPLDRLGVDFALQGVLG